MLSNLKFSFAAFVAMAMLLSMLVPAAAGATVYLSDNATGGDCEIFGDWQVDTRTCTLNRNIAEPVEIISPGLTLNCADNEITAAGRWTPFSSGLWRRGARCGAVAQVWRNTGSRHG